jgi:Fe-S-cluster containining protein
MELSETCKGCGKCCMNYNWKDIPEVTGDNFSFIYGRCNHLNDKNECDIYENRSFVCQMFERGGKECLEMLE